MLEKHTISHFKALFCSNLSLKVQTCILQREFHASFLAKTSLNFALLGECNFEAEMVKDGPI